MLIGTPFLPKIPFFLGAILYFIAFLIFTYLLFDWMYSGIIRKTIVRWKIIVAYIVPIIIFTFLIVNLILKNNINNEYFGKLETIYKQNYLNETVNLDGKRYIDCKFNNVSFIYKGEPFRIENSEVNGVSIVVSDGICVANTITLLRKLNLLKENNIYEERKKNVPR